MNFPKFNQILTGYGSVAQVLMGPKVTSTGQDEQIIARTFPSNMTLIFQSLSGNYYKAPNNKKDIIKPMINKEAPLIENIGLADFIGASRATFI